MQVKGRADLYLRLEVIKKLLIIVAVVLGLRFGIYGLLWGQVAVSVASLFINTFYTAKFLKYAMLQQLADLMPSILIACGIAALIWWGVTCYCSTCKYGQKLLSWLQVMYWHSGGSVA
ncbi:hypothetical protein KUH03_31490 [Sphingobacterium sp. E70]|uniref:hypothetical protein n=1 Tax=Sphingobacterium sp. E70 TaxID=2853439 RepID=UPI00211C71B0|nr:hypothetical protein [Sphingobacterium sp. E70]ULT23650.1 hypothetical protein KUH03_31490 [Sphingobacterium sp. E70]